MSDSPVVILHTGQMLQTWHWLVSEINIRPQAHSTTCYYDRKIWGTDSNAKPLETNTEATENLARLYIMSQLCDHTTVVNLMNGRAIKHLEWGYPKLEGDIVSVISSEDRFRDALSEHLAFWVYVAATAKEKKSQNFARSMPNIQPEDKGPDGLSFVLDPSRDPGRIEIHSVKNSINRPRSIATPAFRKHGNGTDRKKLLEEFWYYTREGYGFQRLQRLVEQVCLHLDLSPSEKIYMALRAECVFDAVVVADDTYADITLFDGYEHVTSEVDRRYATYIGSSNWKEVAQETRQQVISILKDRGMW